MNAYQMHKPSNRPALFTIAGAVAFVAICGIAGNVERAPAPMIGLEVITTSGDSYIIGSGDDCGAAWQGANFEAVPNLEETWRELACVELL